MGMLADPPIFLRTVIVYLAVLAGFRFFGKRQIGQMEPFDFVVVLLIANAVQNAMVGDHSSLWGGLLAALVLLVLNWVVGRVGVLFPTAERFVSGDPVLLIHDGQVLDANLRREAVSLAELMEALREHGVEKPDDVHLAVLEVDGSISVLPLGTKMLRTRKRMRSRKPRQ